MRKSYMKVVESPGELIKPLRLPTTDGRTGYATWTMCTTVVASIAIAENFTSTVKLEQS